MTRKSGAAHRTWCVYLRVRTTTTRIAPLERLARGECKAGGREDQQHEEALELVEEDGEGCPSARLFQPIGPESLAASHHLVVRQSALPVGSQIPHGYVHGQRVPLPHRGGRRWVSTALSERRPQPLELSRRAHVACILLTQVAPLDGDARR